MMTRMRLIWSASGWGIDRQIQINKFVRTSSQAADKYYFALTGAALNQSCVF